MFAKIDFVGGWRLWFTISAVLLLAGIAAIALGNLNFGIDFEGGTKFTAASPERHLSVSEVREALPDSVAQHAVIQRAGSGYEVRTPVLGQSERTEVENALNEALDGQPPDWLRTQECR